MICTGNFPFFRLRIKIKFIPFKYFLKFDILPSACFVSFFLYTYVENICLTQNNAQDFINNLYVFVHYSGIWVLDYNFDLMNRSNAIRDLKGWIKVVFRQFKFNKISSFYIKMYEFVTCLMRRDISLWQSCMWKVKVIQHNDEYKIRYQSGFDNTNCFIQNGFVFMCDFTQTWKLL